MVDNALEVNLMEQVSYGDSPRWEASDTKTLLNTKLGVKEVEGTVTAISKTAKLDEEELELDDDVVYEMVIDVNTESLFLKEVKLLHKDKKVVWVSVETAEKDIMFDTVADATETSIELKVADKEYDLIDDDDVDFVVYINYEKKEISNVDEGMYGYFIFDGKEIMAANLFDFDEAGFVTGVEDDEVEFIELDGAEEDLLVLDDYDEIFVYNKDFTKAEVEDIDENTVMFYYENEDDDELFVMLVNDVVEGEVTRVRTDRVTIDGKNYKTTDASIISSDEGKEYEELDKKVTDYDIIDEEVVLYLDLNGDIAALVTAAEATSETLYGIVTWFYEGRNPSVEVFTSEGEEVEYFFEERADASVLLDKKIVQKVNKGQNVWAIKYKLTSDGEIAEDSMEIIMEIIDENGADFADFAVVNGVAVNGVVKGTKDTVKKDADRKFVTIGTGDDEKVYYIGSGTVIMQAMDGTELDPEVIDYEDLIDLGIKENGDAIIFGEDGKTAKMIVFTSEDFEGSKKDVYFGVVTDDPWKTSGDKWFSAIDVFEEGKADYRVESGDVKKGDLVAFYLGSSDKVKRVAIFGSKKELSTSGYDAEIVPGVVYDRDGSTIELVDGGTYRIASGAVLYKLDKDYKLDGTIRLTQIKKDDTIALLVDTKEKEVVAVIVNAKLD